MPGRAYLPSSEYLTQSAARQIILVMTLLCYHMWFQIDFTYSCSHDSNFIHCYGYMLLPSLIIISLILWNDRRMGRLFRFGCYHSSPKKRRCSYKFGFEFFLYLLQAASSGFLWCGSVLVDGDWYVCCRNGNTEEVLSLCCFNESDVRPVETQRRANLKNESMVIGLICILLTAACSFILMLPWSKWCTRRNHFRLMLEEAILEQTESILLNEMGRAAADSVIKSLTSLSSIKNTSTPLHENNAPEAVGKRQEEEKMLLNLNVNWQKVAHVAGGVIESIPK